MTESNRKPSRRAQNRPLHRARNAKYDEFYTQLSDIENELRHYTKHFFGKVVYCNCDDPRVSNFYHYFAHQFSRLGIKRLITTCYKNQERDLFSRHDSEKSISLELIGDEKRSDGRYLPPDPMIRHLKGDGDFRSKECISLLEQADIVCTNPPFSLFREYVPQLIEYDKKFIIIGNKNAITYKEIFPLIKNNQLWVGHTSMSKDLLFDLPVDYANRLLETKKIGSAYKYVNGVVKGRSQSIWFTNLDHTKRHEKLISGKSYNPDDYPRYDNYDAIDVGRVVDIPEDYDEAMGVPITFLDKYNPIQFEILNANNIRTNNHVPIKEHGLIKDKDGTVKGRAKYARIVIKRKSCK